MTKRLYHIVLVFLWITQLTNAQNIHAKLENQVSAWSTANFENPNGYQLGGRYIPSLNLDDSLRKDQLLSAEISMNAFGSWYWRGNVHDFDGRIKPYRLWLRYSLPRFEVRIGLQKINFGSANMLRPLMWFDRIDVRDPLQLTDGVYSILGRYYFQNNMNIWLWILYGNKETRGWETFPTKYHTPEFGGRIQLPVPRGEVGLSYHFRTAFASVPLPADTLRQDIPESRLGLDGKWDLGIGLWFESVIRQNHVSGAYILPYETYFNAGMDYTFGVGNGINAIVEYFRYGSHDALFKSIRHDDFSALSANYPFGLMNTFSAIVFYNWSQHSWYRYISLQRKYDYFSFYLMGFWNPEQFSLYNLAQDRNLFAGKGIQFMTVVNF